MAISRASAVSAFSPPESSSTFCRRLPGGCAAMSMPASPAAVRLGQAHLPGSSAEERLEGRGEMRVDHGKGLFELLPGDLVQLA